MEVEDDRGHSFVAQFAQPLSSGEVALPGDRTKRVKAGSKELWYSARKFGADEAYKLALRHTASKAIDVSKILTLEEQCPDQAMERPVAFVLSQCPPEAQGEFPALEAVASQELGHETDTRSESTPVFHRMLEELARTPSPARSRPKARTLEPATPTPPLLRELMRTPSPKSELPVFRRMMDELARTPSPATRAPDERPTRKRTRSTSPPARRNGA